MPHSTRRTFLKTASLPALGAVSAFASTSAPISYLSTDNSIQVIRISKGRRLKLQTISSSRPRFLLHDSARKFLFVANEISEYNGLPTATVESFRIQPANGFLELVSRAPLSLSATLPRHLAISPDDRFLIIPAFGGGSYNVLPVDYHGKLGALTQVVKEIGSSVHPQHQTCAHPHSVVFHPSGRFVVGTDLGSDRINVFSFDSGRLRRTHQLAAPVGSGPSHLQIDSGGSLINVSHEFTPHIQRYRFDPARGVLTLSLA